MDACKHAAAKKERLTNLKTKLGSKTSVAYVPPTTTALRGRRKMFKMAPCRESGTYLDLSVPATGMNNPTHASTTRKLTIVMMRVSDEVLESE